MDCTSACNFSHCSETLLMSSCKLSCASEALRALSESAGVMAAPSRRRAATSSLRRWKSLISTPPPLLLNAAISAFRPSSSSRPQLTSCALRCAMSLRMPSKLTVPSTTSLFDAATSLFNAARSQRTDSNPDFESSLVPRKTTRSAFNRSSSSAAMPPSLLDRIATKSALIRSTSPFKSALIRSTSLLNDASFGISESKLDLSAATSAAVASCKVFADSACSEVRVTPSETKEMASSSADSDTFAFKSDRKLSSCSCSSVRSSTGVSRCAWSSWLSRCATLAVVDACSSTACRNPCTRSLRTLTCCRRSSLEASSWAIVALTSAGAAPAVGSERCNRSTCCRSSSTCCWRLSNEALRLANWATSRIDPPGEPPGVPADFGRAPSLTSSMNFRKSSTCDL
mmetsp:Transcript_103656/g.299835  ORF Transcript_103656/g.299835 Transcript_103656/m.299835 type:complete len:399 (-) Transcript_103656:1607-2803(-)